MILAAGRGNRMRPLTDHTPKPLLKVGGKPLVVWHLENLAKAGFCEIVINHAHLGAQIEATLGDGSQWNVSIRYSAEGTALETAGGIVKALPLLGTDPFLVVNGDVFIDIDFTHLKHVLPATKLAYLVMVNNPPQHPKGDFVYRDGKLGLEGEPKLTFSGVAVYHPSLFAGIVPGHVAKLAPLLQQAILRDHACAERHQGVWHDVGTPERLDELDRQLTDQQQSRLIS